jgi:flagellar L-ring protein precursor FlgH
MKIKLIHTVILTIVLLCLVNSSQADSIWSKRDKNLKDLYSDDVARQIGDVITINITEDSKLDNKAKKDLKKETDRSGAFNGDLGIVTDNSNILPRIPGFTMNAETSNQFKGQADFKDERSFTDSITAVVIDILPNRNLVILGTRSRDIAGEKQTIEVSGIVRPSDIAFDNTIQSEQIANFRIFTENDGTSDTYNKIGWLGRLFDFLWPF